MSTCHDGRGRGADGTRENPARGVRAGQTGLPRCHHDTPSAVAPTAIRTVWRISQARLPPGKARRNMGQLPLRALAKCHQRPAIGGESGSHTALSCAGIVLSGLGDGAVAFGVSCNRAGPRIPRKSSRSGPALRWQPNRCISHFLAVSGYLQVDPGTGSWIRTPSDVNRQSAGNLTTEVDGELLPANVL